MQATRPGPLAILRWLLDAAVVGLVAVVLLSVVLGRLVPMTGDRTLIIGGPSMEPTLPLGSAVVITPVAPDDIAVGDIVSVQGGPATAIYTHRVVRTLELRGERYLETKGDNNLTPDGATVPAVAVIGRVARVVPLMGFALAWLSEPSGVASTLGLGVLLVVAVLLVESVEADRQRARRPSAPATALMTDASTAAAVAATPMAGASPATAVAVAPAAARGGRRRGRVPDPTVDIDPYAPGGATMAVGAEAIAALVRPRDRRPALGTEPHTVQARQPRRRRSRRAAA